MRDLEEVIKGLEVCVSREPGGDYICDKCPYEVDGNDCEINSINDAIALLKEQEAKTGHWIFESRYCDAWSNICSECGRLMTTGAGVYANYCSNCGAKMTGGEV